MKNCNYDSNVPSFIMKGVHYEAVTVLEWHQVKSSEVPGTHHAMDCPTL